MQIVQKLAGYTMGQADNIRRAMSKKKQHVIDEGRKSFVYGDEKENIKGCVANGISEQAANKIYDSMVDFAKYAFNKSHAAAYAVISMQTAWLKYYYPTEYMAALLTSVIDNTDKMSEYLYQCKNLGIEVLPPSVNTGEGVFSVEGKNIRFGMYAIKSLGRQIIDSLVKERKNNGEYISLWDFVQRASNYDINKRAVENLIKAGACDCFDSTRKEMVYVHAMMVDKVSSGKKNNIAGQMSLFDLVSEEEKKEFEFKMPKVGEFDKEMLLSFEKEVLSIYLSGHPLDEYREKINKNATAITSDFIIDMETNEQKIKDGQKVIMGGIISEKSIKFTKKNQPMAFLKIEDLVGSVEVIVFPRQYQKVMGRLEVDDKIFVKGKAAVENDQNGKVIAEDIIYFDELGRDLWIKFKTMQEYENEVDELMQLFTNNIGKDEVIIYIENPKSIKKFGKSLTVDAKNALFDTLINKYGKNNVKVIEKNIENN